MTDLDIQRQENRLQRVRLNFEAKHAAGGGWDKLQELVQAGASLSVIGQHFGLSRQRVSQIVKAGGLR